MVKKIEEFFKESVSNVEQQLAEELNGVWDADVVKNVVEYSKKLGYTDDRELYTFVSDVCYIWSNALKDTK